VRLVFVAIGVTACAQNAVLEGSGNPVPRLSPLFRSRLAHPLATWFDFEVE